MPKINTRAKGHAFERRLVKIFRELGYNACVTSRSESRATDAEGIDLCNTGSWQVQAKAVENLGPVHAVLDRMPKRKGKYNVVFHKRNRVGTTVSMSEEDFLNILTQLIKCGIIVPK